MRSAALPHPPRVSEGTTARAGTKRRLSDMIPVLDGPWHDAGRIPFGYGDSNAVRSEVGRDFTGVSAGSSRYDRCRCGSASRVRWGISGFPAQLGRCARESPRGLATGAVSIAPGALMPPVPALGAARGVRRAVVLAMTSGISVEAG